MARDEWPSLVRSLEEFSFRRDGREGWWMVRLGIDWLGFMEKVRS